MRTGDKIATPLDSLRTLVPLQQNAAPQRHGYRARRLGEKTERLEAGTLEALPGAMCNLATAYPPLEL